MDVDLVFPNIPPLTDDLGHTGNRFDITLDNPVLQGTQVRDIVVICRSGNRSTVAAQILMQKGFENLSHLQHGIKAWQKAGYPVVR